MRNRKDLYHAAIYLRISRDDEDKMESDSIQNQRELLKAYIEKDPEIELTKEFVDDGYTGTNFDRPGFQDMMDMVQEKKIDCILVKDLSRLGRNYIETGRYIDQIFPLLGVRFISVNDHYDNFSEHNDADDIIVPFKNLINDAYCRDISIKIRSQLEVKRKNGKFVGSSVVYGYKKDPDDKSHLIIDEKPADIVRMIFDMKLDGYSPYRIAKKLNEMGVLTPFQYKQSVGIKCNSGYWKGEYPHWVAPTVVRILTNEVYIGNMVQGKQRKVNYKIKKVEPVDEKDWVRVEGTHEPIVSKAVFERVQEILRMDTRTSPSKETVGLFAGLVKCSDCGENMTLVVRHKGGKTYHYYACSTAKSKGPCEYHSINAEKLEATIQRLVDNQIGLLLNVDELLRNKESMSFESHRVRVINAQIETVEEEIVRYRQIKERLQVDFQDEIIDKDDYEDLKEKFAYNLENSMQVRNALQKQRDEIKDEPILPPDWVDEIRKCGTIGKLTRRVVVMLIDQITVYKRGRIEVAFRYGDEIKAVADYFGEAVKTGKMKVTA